jgi:hypothetical protein
MRLSNGRLKELAAAIRFVDKAAECIPCPHVMDRLVDQWHNVLVCMIKRNWIRNHFECGNNCRRET